MRDDWVAIDFARAFMPNWMAKATSLKVVSIVTVALLLVIALKAGR